MNILNLEKLKSFAKYCGELWCDWHIITISNNIIYITTDASKWIIHLTDYDKFKRYILWHYSMNENNNRYHKQYSYCSIYNAVANAFAHDFDKKYGVDFHKEDFSRLKEDFNRLYNM